MRKYILAALLFTMAPSAHADGSSTAIAWGTGGLVVLFLVATVATHYRYCAKTPKCYVAERDGLPK